MRARSALAGGGLAGGGPCSGETAQPAERCACVPGRQPPPTTTERRDLIPGPFPSPASAATPAEDMPRGPAVHPQGADRRQPPSLLSRSSPAGSPCSTRPAPSLGPNPRPWRKGGPLPPETDRSTQAAGVARPNRALARFASHNHLGALSITSPSPVLRTPIKEGREHPSAGRLPPNALRALFEPETQLRSRLSAYAVDPNRRKQERQTITVQVRVEV